MAGERTDYNAEQVAAARAVLIEMSHLLGSYRCEMGVIGGWVPDLLLGGGPVRHVGSVDVDIALDHRRLQEAGYRTIDQILRGAGYQQGSQPFIYHVWYRSPGGRLPLR